MLLGGYAGMLAGGVGAVARAENREVALDAISKQIEPGHTVLVAEVGEVATEVVDDIAGPLQGTVIRRPAAVVYDEIQLAKAAQDAADAEARQVLREQRRAEHKDKWEQFRLHARRAALAARPRFGGLVRLCLARSIQPVVLRPGQDLAALAEAAVAGGAVATS